ncbi:hypothetical protein LTSEHVI_4576, partial [Salmonella enterica subsp. enterica serovar Hvittingfoss str. A4-620]
MGFFILKKQGLPLKMNLYIIGVNTSMKNANIIPQR